MRKINFKEELLTAANIMPSSSLNIPKNGDAEKAFYAYKKIQNNLFRRIIFKKQNKKYKKKFKDLLK